MKKLSFIFSILILLISYSAFASDSLRVEFTITKEKECQILTLTVVTNDTTRQGYYEKATSLFNLFGDDKPGNIDKEALQANIAAQIKENKDVELYIVRPDYFNEILELIKNRNDKEKAMALYDKQFGNTSITVNRGYSSNSYYSASKGGDSNNDNVKTYKATIVITIFLKVKKNTKLMLNSIKFLDNYKFYDTYKVEIELEK